MKTLIISGSQRRNGDSAYLTELLVQRLKGDVSYRYKVRFINP